MHINPRRIFSQYSTLIRKNPVAGSRNSKSPPLPYPRLLTPPHRLLPLKHNPPQQIPPPSPNSPPANRIIRIHLLRRVPSNIQVHHKRLPTQKHARQDRRQHRQKEQAKVDWEKNDGQDDRGYGAHDLTGQVWEDVVQEGGLIVRFGRGLGWGDGRVGAEEVEAGGTWWVGGFRRGLHFMGLNDEAVSMSYVLCSSSTHGQRKSVSESSDFEAVRSTWGLNIVTYANKRSELSEFSRDRQINLCLMSRAYHLNHTSGHVLRTHPSRDLSLPSEAYAQDRQWSCNRH